MPHDICTQFATALYPLRPSRLATLVSCPMSALLMAIDGERSGGSAADTGSLVHAGAAGYHRAANSEEAGVAALEAARDTFPAGDIEKARTIFTAYARDKENQTAVVTHVEQPVRLIIPAHPSDPTGADIVIEGTLDQIRRHPDGVSRVWDIKTGYALDADETILHYMIQQAGYTLAARESVDPGVLPGGIIYTPGYEKPRGRRHLDLKLDIERCIMLLHPVRVLVAAVRRGEPMANPGSACRYCPQKTFHTCSTRFLRVLS